MISIVYTSKLQVTFYKLDYFLTNTVLFRIKENLSMLSSSYKLTGLSYYSEVKDSPDMKDLPVIPGST